MPDILHEYDPLKLLDQHGKLRVWVRSRLWAQVLIAMLLGIAAGTAMGPAAGLVEPSTARLVGSWLALPGALFLGLIAIVLVPLVFASIVGGIAGTQSGAAMRAIALRLGGFILVATTLAALIGVFLAGLFRPGASVQSMASTGSAPPPAADATAFDPVRLPDLLIGVLPTNPAVSVVQGDLLAVVVLALLTGVAATQVRSERARPFLALMDSLLSISMTIVKWAMMLSPYAVFGLMAQLMSQIGVGSLMGLATYVGTVLLGLAILFALYLLVLVLFAHVGPRTFLAAAGQNLLLAFSTSSSSAVMPSTVQSARRLKVPEGISNLVIPVGATMNMAGTALYQSVAIFFLAQMAGVELGGGQTLLVVGTLVASSIGAPGTPGVSIAILASVAAGFGIPAEGLVIILGVDRLLDMSRTVVNVTGDLTAAVLLKDLELAPAQASPPPGRAT